jgi:Mg-chelatase subunit ChlD
VSGLAAIEDEAQPGMQRALTPGEVASQLQEALVMAGMVSLRNDLAVEIGDWWTFNWKTNVISLPKAELATRTREEISWIILHEAAHAALTRLHDILPVNLRARPEIHALLNCIEDVRIEAWLVERFPGSRAWKACTDARPLNEKGEPEWATPDAHPVSSFLNGILECGISGNIPSGMNPEARAALEQARPSLDAAFACLPPSVAVGSLSVDALYRNHVVAGAYSDADQYTDPSSMEKWVRIMQATMWIHVANGVLPAYLRLIKEHGAVELPHSRSMSVVRAGAGHRTPLSEEQLQRALRAELAGKTNHPYRSAVCKYAEQIRSASDILMQLLPNHRGLRHSRGFRSGDRLDLRAAAQFEADPRLYEKLWMQRRRRTLPDPAFLFLLDRSESMKQEGKSAAAFDSSVMIREACTRCGIPFSIVLFNDDAVCIHGWEKKSDAHAEAALSLVLKPDGGTNLLNALRFAMRSMEARKEKDRIVFLLTDGMVPEDVGLEVKKEAARFADDGIRIVAIGIGQETQDIRSLFPEALVVQDAGALPGVLADGLTRTLIDPGGS